MDILDRKSAPLTEEEWTRIDEAVVKTARTMLVGRKVIEVLGPLGPGVYSMPYAIFTGRKAVGVDMIGDREDLVVEADRRVTVNMPIIFKDFKIFWRDVEADRHLGIPLDVSTAAVAAADVAVQEDDLIFNGHGDLGQKGLLNVEGRLTVGIGDWQEGGGPLADAVKAVNALTTAGHYGPYAMAVNPFLYGQTVRVYGNTGMHELERELSMELYLMRHGQAVPEAENPEQPLSREGVAQIQASAAAMKRLGIALDVIVCSPKRRAHQTAALVAEAVHYPYSDIVTSETVNPNASAAAAIDFLRQFRSSKSVLIAGHLPSLVEIASVLLTGAPGMAIGFDNGDLCRIDLPDPAAAELRWHLPAKLLRQLKGA